MMETNTLEAAPGRSSLLAVALLLGLAACAQDRGPTPITETRTASRPSRSVFLGATPEDRFGSFLAPGTPGSKGAGESLPGAPEVPELLYDLPAGWTRLEPSQMRLLNFRPADDPDSVCYLTALSGDGGGTVANVNRWRAQMGQPPLSDAEVGALPTHPFLGGPGVLVTVHGTLTDMSGDPRPDSMLVGLVLTHTQFAFFLKMTGPASVVDGEVERFLRLASSIRLGDSPAPRSEPSDAPGDAGFAYAAPEGWREQPASNMRAVSFEIGSGATECYVAVLGGGGGGLGPNVDRWRKQLGLEPLAEGALARLPRVPVLGTDGVLVELSGDYEDMDGTPHSGYSLLGVIVERGSGLVFVKMVGPAAEVAEQRGRFLAFAESLEARR